MIYLYIFLAWFIPAILCWVLVKWFHKLSLVDVDNSDVLIVLCPVINIAGIFLLIIALIQKIINNDFANKFFRIK